MITVRKANLDDLKIVAQLFDAYRVFYRKESDIKGAEQYLSERISHQESIIYIASENDIPVGFTQLYPLFSSTRMKKSWLLNDLFVDKNHRGKGISKRLIDCAKELAKTTNAAGVSLETEKSNIIGNKLYPSVGFELDEDHNFYYWSNT